MNLRENGAMEAEEARNLLKQSQLKAKRRGVPVDRERLYEENQQLRGRLRELQEANLRLKTQVAVAEKQKEDLFNMAEEPPQRSQSGAHKMSAGPPQGRSNFTLLKEKQNSAFKKLLRDRQNENDKLRIENQNIKKTMKFTRLSQLVTENNQLGEESRRLRIQVLQARNETQQIAGQYSERIDMLRKELQQEKDGEKRNGVQLKRQQEANNELKEKIRDCELRKVQVEKRLCREIKLLKAENQELRLKVNNEATGKDCDKQDCLKNKKEKADLKKKVQQQEKEIKHLQSDLHVERSRGIEMQLQLRSQTQASKQSKRPSEPKANSTIVPQKKEEEKTPKMPSSPQKIEVVEPVIVPAKKNQITQPFKQKVQEKPKSTIVIQEKPKNTEVLVDKSDVILEAVQIKPIPAELAQKPAISERKPEEKVESKPKEQPNDSYDTEKLLESYESSHEKVQTKPAQEEPKKETKNIQEDQYKESDGEYEQIDFDQEEPKKVVKEQPKPKEKEKEKEKEKVKVKEKDNEKEKKSKGKKQKQKEKEKQVVKPKSKSTKKLQSDEEVLYDGNKDQDEDGKAQLKIIRETLTYKFMAQGYSYEEFANYLKESKKKYFGVEDIMSILGEEPFLLGEEHVEAVIIYLFETNNLTGEQTLSSKIFAKKIKKFIGKAKPLDEETEKEHISHLITLIQADQRGKKKIRKQCEKNDSGDGTITRDVFLSILKSAGVQEELLETALSQITYTSVDINHLNYDVFIKRFNEAE